MVVCRQLGYTGVVNELVEVDNGISDGKIWLSRVACMGTETSIGDCFMEKSWGDNTCDHQDDVAVECNTGEYDEVVAVYIGC